jgi:hypothetical protein
MKYLAVVTLLILFGCTALAPHTRTIYVPEGDAVMLRESVKADIWAWPAPNEDPVAGNMMLHEGWT